MEIEFPNSKISYIILPPRTMNSNQTQIGKKVEEMTRDSAGNVIFKAISCECGGAVFYDEHGDPVCIKCGLIQ